MDDGQALVLVWEVNVNGEFIKSDLHWIVRANRKGITSSKG